MYEYPLHTMTEEMLTGLQDFIIDIDSIEAHGRHIPESLSLVFCTSILTDCAGIGVADITKLKTNGFYTVVVCAVL